MSRFEMDLLPSAQVLQAVYISVPSMSYLYYLLHGLFCRIMEYAAHEKLSKTMTDRTFPRFTTANLPYKALPFHWGSLLTPTTCYYHDYSPPSRDR